MRQKWTSKWFCVLTYKIWVLFHQINILHHQGEQNKGGMEVANLEKEDISHAKIRMTHLN